MRNPPSFEDYHERLSSGISQHGGEKQPHKNNNKRRSGSSATGLGALDANMIDSIKSIAASTAAMTVASMSDMHNQFADSREHNFSVPAVVTSDDSDKSSEVSRMNDEKLSEELNLVQNRLSKLEETQLSRKTIADQAFVKKTNAELAKAQVKIEMLITSLDDANSAIASLRKQLDELREWDRIEVTWKIENFESKLNDRDVNLYSDEVHVSGYTMNLNCTIKAADADKADRDVGIYIMHWGRLNFFPIRIGGSSITVCGNGSYPDLRSSLRADVTIKQINHGYGWKKLASLKDVRAKYLWENELTVKATIQLCDPSL